MPMQKYIRALCYEHHVEMRLRQVLPKAQPESTPFLTYACPEPGCAVHYNSSEGYFIAAPDGSQIERDMAPLVRCVRDKTLMYLAAIPQRDLRHWKCPQCDAVRTNDELTEKLRTP
jgi:hypothetical protein